MPGKNFLIVFSIVLASLGQGQSLRKCDRKFMEAAALSNIYQMQLAEVYEEKGTDPVLKSFALFSSEQNLKIAGDLKELAGKKGLVLPQMLRKGQGRCVHKLSGTDGNKLSKKYQRLVQRNLKYLERKYKKEASKTKDEEIRTFAVNSLNAIEQQISKLTPVRETQ